MQIGHRKEFLQLSFEREPFVVYSDEGLTLATSALKKVVEMTSFALSTQLIKANYLVELPTEATPHTIHKAK